MIILKNESALHAMRLAGRITGEALMLAGEAVREGISTAELDGIVRRHIEKCGAKPSFLGYGGFPASACVSVNDEVIHGIPSVSRILREGDIVSIDVGAYIGGYHGDSANTFAVGKISEGAARLIEATKQSFYEAMKFAYPDKRLGDLGNAVESHVKRYGYSVVRQFIGHGVGRELHEDPEVPNYGTPGRGVRLSAGMTIAVEPMVCMGSGEVKVDKRDKWTVTTVDGSLSAHYEHSVAITDNGPEFLTLIT